MASATKENYTVLFDTIIELEDEKKTISQDIAERMKLFADQYGINPKALKKGFASFKEYRKDAGEFHEVDADTDTIMNILFSTKEGAE